MSRLITGLIALLLGGVVAAVTGAAAFLWPSLIGEPDLFLAWGWVAFFVSPLVALAVWTVTTPLFYSMLVRRSAAPWVTAGLSLLLVVGVWLSIGEQLTGIVNRRWTEDVRLADGSVVVVERSARIEHSHIVELDASMKFTGKLAFLAELRVPFAPLVLYLDEDAGEWVTVATTSRCEVIHARGSPRYWFAADRPQTKYFEFRWRTGHWVQTPLSVASIGQPANLFTRFEETKTSHLTVSAKEQLERESGPDYQSVLERPMYTCGRTSISQPIWDAEDQVLAALDRENATAEQEARVGELLAGTRFVFLGFRTAATESQQDKDPATVLIVSIDARRSSSASDDGRVIYLNADAGESFKQSYSRRLSAAGLAQFAQ
jgi:hypothetical protein